MCHNKLVKLAFAQIAQTPKPIDLRNDRREVNASNNDRNGDLVTLPLEIIGKSQHLLNLVVGLKQILTSFWQNSNITKTL